MSQDIGIVGDIRRVSKARLVITAVVIEGRSQSQVARNLGVSAGRPLPIRGRGRIRTTLTASTHQPGPPTADHHRPDHRVAPHPGRQRTRQRAAHHRLAPRTPPPPVGSVASISRTVEKHVRSILTKLDLSETGNDHRRVLAVITFLEAH
jgi:hypothetical protein